MTVWDSTTSHIANGAEQGAGLGLSIVAVAAKLTRVSVELSDNAWGW